MLRYSPVVPRRSVPSSCRTTRLERFHLTRESELAFRFRPAALRCAKVWSSTLLLKRETTRREATVRCHRFLQSKGGERNFRAGRPGPHQSSSPVLIHDASDQQENDEAMEFGVVATATALHRSRRLTWAPVEENEKQKKKLLVHAYAVS